MSISLRNAMKLGKFNECKLVAGHEGLSRIIENVTIMEVPEVVQWLNGKEVILTSLFAIKDDIDAQNNLVQNLHNSGATALAIKPSRFIKTIPKEIINSGNKLGFPIIEVPSHIKYLDILSPVMHYIFNDKVVLQEDLEQANRILHEVSINAQSIQEFLNNVSYLTKNIITIESEISYVYAPPPPQKISPLTKEQINELSIIGRPLHFKREFGGELVSTITAPIMNDGEYLGNISCWEVHNDNLSIDLAILEKASSLLALEFLKLQVKYEVEQRYKRDFIRELLFSENIKGKKIIEWGDQYCITRETEYICLSLYFSGSDSNNEKVIQAFEYKINESIQKIRSSSLIGYLKGNVVIIFPVEEGDSKKIYNEIYAALCDYADLPPPVYLGVGRIGKGPEGIQESFMQSEKAINLNMTLRNSEGVFYYEDLGAYRLLDQLRGSEELESFYLETLGKLVEQDSKNELIKTVRAYFFHNEVLKNTAKSLYIHINTLKYRIKKIEDITGCDLKTSEGKLNFLLGLKVHDLLYQEKRQV